MTHGGGHRLGQWLGGLAVAVAAALLVTATPAQAAPVNNVYFNSNVVDFGTNLDPFAFTLRDPGTLTFERVGNGYRPRLWGAVLMKELNGFCGRMGLDYYNASNTLIASHRHTALCPTNDGPWLQTYDWAPYTSTSYVYVRVSTWDKAGSGPWYLGHYLYLYP